MKRFKRVAKIDPVFSFHFFVAFISMTVQPDLLPHILLKEVISILLREGHPLQTLSAVSRQFRLVSLYLLNVKLKEGTTFELLLKSTTTYTTTYSIPRFKFSYSHWTGESFSFSPKSIDRVFMNDMSVVKSTTTKPSNPPLAYMDSCFIDELEFFFRAGEEVKRIKLVDQSPRVLNFGIVRINIHKEGRMLVFDSVECGIGFKRVRSATGKKREAKKEVAKYVKQRFWTPSSIECSWFTCS
jgi:hypothetical protein